MKNELETNFSLATIYDKETSSAGAKFNEQRLNEKNVYGTNFET